MPEKQDEGGQCMIKIFMVGRVDEGNSKRCLKQGGNLE